MKLVKTIFIILLAILSINSCTELEETMYSNITTDSFYSNEQECLLAVGNIYSALRQTNSLWGAYSAQVLATDEAVIPLRDAGYSLNNNGIFLSMHRHEFYPQLQLCGGPWSLYFSVASKCNDVLGAIESTSASFASKDALIAELKTMRAFAYYNLLDLYGDVPVVLDYTDKGLPVQRTRQEAFDMVETELLENYLLLETVPSTATYGRATKSMAAIVLAKMYLNADEWFGTPMFDEAIAMCDVVINSGYYSLATNYFDNFKINNTSSGENIFVIPYDRTVDSWGFVHHVIGLPPSLSPKYGYNISWNGICAPPEFYNIFDPADSRIKSFEVGPQLNWDGSQITGLNGLPFSFTNTISNILNAGEGEGARFFKYEYPMALSWLESMDNDWAVYRYSDVLLMKAEAIMRKNGGAANQAAVDLVNLVRERAFGDQSGNYTTVTLTLDEMLDERGRELAWEGHRRQDQIRFGTFGDAWFEKVEWADDHKKLYPIPSSPLIANPNLVQNPGY